MPTLSPKITLCADDYGLSPEINHGILDLVKMQRLNAVSCMMNFSNISPDFADLKPHHNHIDIGLHFNLTEGVALTGTSSLTDSSAQFTHINHLLCLSTLRRIKQHDVERELNAQLDQFETAFHCLPHFIDGHQHVHHLPVIRDALLQVYQQRLSNAKPYIRSVYIPWQQVIKLREPKIAIIQLTGAQRFLSLLNKAEIPHNHSFAGFYNFDDKINYRQRFQQFLKLINKDGLIMCHPGLLNKNDPIGLARQNEYHYFASDAFVEDWGDLANTNG